MIDVKCSDSRTFKIAIGPSYISDIFNTQVKLRWATGVCYSVRVRTVFRDSLDLRQQHYCSCLLCVTWSEVFITSVPWLLGAERREKW